MTDYTIKELTDMVRAFCGERDWDQFHNPKDLAIGISTEANELLDIFRFKNAEEMMGLFKEPKQREHIEEELADVLFFVLRFAQMNNIELKHALETKIEKNAKKYPVEQAKGQNKKYNEF
ncbi:nucleotide pyrophosphohydrolase [Parasporobacterium paucivorans]|uniref:NTP pyrophosphatase, house-cleaning of non-canonical NTPs n=1 Tax=Parasporobacterium paucivorans DSM 15970 TaxID=1122934 RepID=A0A1M6IEZ1_9FIRM|nr:nucleotide pyrophosphohydrolase [Parasporobacterium paucivorans]SHJ32998.1 NTP pyrophosphatase, house-cleaning of non-canonical NTPs [Parasporobacterium paucivorans DSM 15970]